MNHGEILREEYTALRAEICQSISKQHQISLAGYGLSAAIFGYIIGSSIVDLRGLMVIPVVLLAMISLWAVECNRMVRASYYIAYELWPALCKFTECQSDKGWETWIRIQDGNEGDFRKRQHFLQQIVIFFIPAFLSLVVVSIVVENIRKEPAWFLACLFFTFVLILVWIIVYLSIRKISDLGAVVPNPTSLRDDA